MWPEAAVCASPRDSRSQDPDDAQDGAPQVLIGIIVCSYPGRVKATRNFAGFCPLETQYSERMCLSDPRYFVKTERYSVHVELGGLSPLPGTPVAVKGRMDVRREVFVCEDAAFCYNGLRVDRIQAEDELSRLSAQRVAFQHRLPANHIAFRQFVEQNGIRALVMNQVQRNDGEDWGSEYRPTEAYLQARFDFLHSDRVVASIKQAVDQLVVLPTPSDATTESYPQYPFPEVIYERASKAGVKFRPNPAVCDVLGTKTLIVDGLLNRYYPAEEIALGIVRAANTNVCGGLLLDYICEREDDFYLTKNKVEQIIVLGAQEDAIFRVYNDIIGIKCVFIKSCAVLGD